MQINYYKNSQIKLSKAYLCILLLICLYKQKLVIDPNLYYKLLTNQMTILKKLLTNQKHLKKVI